MTLPVNFDSVSVDAILTDWVAALSEQGVEAVVVLGPIPTGGRDDREVLAVHPPRLLGPAQALAESRDFGASWRDSDAPLVAWQEISKSAFADQTGRWLAPGAAGISRRPPTGAAGTGTDVNSLNIEQ